MQDSDYLGGIGCLDSTRPVGSNPHGLFLCQVVGVNLLAISLQVIVG